MSDNCRFVVAIHALTYLAHHGERTCSSEKIAESVNTNAVVIRRLMLQLRDAELVRAIPGRCGGFVLNRAADEITMDRVYYAVEVGPIISSPTSAPNGDCIIANRLHEVLEQTISEAQRDFLSNLAKTSLQMVVNRMALAHTA